MDDPLSSGGVGIGHILIYVVFHFLSHNLLLHELLQLLPEEVIVLVL